MMWLDERRGHAIDWMTQRWVQATGQRLSLSETPWLAGPVGSVTGIGADFFEQWGQAHGLTLASPMPHDGLIEGLSALGGPRFDPGDAHPLIDDFYAHTSGFDLELSSRWSGPFRAVGWLIARIFARRLK